MGAYMEMLSRPGVFSHGRVDTGGLALYDSVELKTVKVFWNLVLEPVLLAY